MNLLMVSGDRQVVIGERGPFHAMQREFSRYFDRVDVICPRPEGEIVQRSLFGNVHFHPAHVGRRGMVAFIETRGAELVREHRPGLIVSHDYGWFYNGIGSARLSRATGVPYLSEIHHVPGVPVVADLRERLDRFVARCYIGWARSRARAFRVVNKVEMPALLRRWHVPAEKVLVLPSLYIDLETFHPPAEPMEAERDVLFVGRLVNNKGVDKIAAALGILARKGQPTSAMFVGRGPLQGSLRRQVEAAGIGDRVELVEWVDSPADLAQLYRTSRVVVCASTCEGGPRFTVEAMASGTPVVSTPVGVMSDLLSDGRAGALTGFDAERLAATLGDVLGDEERRRRLGEVAAERALSFEYERALGVYANGLRKLAGEPLLAPEQRRPRWEEES